MSPDFAWIIPVIIPFIIGLLGGFIIKHTMKFIFLIIAMIIVLGVGGYVSLSFTDIYGKAMEYLPVIIELGGGLQNTLPYMSATFLIGLALGLWRG